MRRKSEGIPLILDCHAINASYVAHQCQCNVTSLGLPNAVSLSPVSRRPRAVIILLKSPGKTSSVVIVSFGGSGSSGEIAPTDSPQ